MTSDQFTAPERLQLATLSGQLQRLALDDDGVALGTVLAWWRTMGLFLLAVHRDHGREAPMPWPPLHRPAQRGRARAARGRRRSTTHVGH
jgi:hypothetical protein